jgi:hypothetical protein
LYVVVKPNHVTLIRARSVVQVHPGPPFKSPVNTRLFSLFPFRGISLSKNQFVNYLSTLRLAGWHYTQGVKALRVKAERPASIRRCREGGVSRRRTWKAVQDNARLGALILALCLRFISSGDPIQHYARQQPQQPARLGVAPIGMNGIMLAG